MSGVSYVYNVQAKPQFTRKRQFKRFIRPVQSTSPWTVPEAFPRDAGWITITVHPMPIFPVPGSPNYRFSFEVAGGMGTVPRDPRSNFYNIQGTEEGCEILLHEATNDNMIVARDLDTGRVWEFQFYPYSSVAPTVLLKSGTAFSADDTVEIFVTDHVPF
jgi:hypothetical protein